MSKDILIVDDDELMLWGLERFFSSIGMSVTTLCCGKDCLPHLEQNSYTFVFLDINIGDADGLELLSEIKKKEFQSRVIIMTGEDTEINREKAVRGGAYAFVKKPFELSELSQLVKDSLGTDVGDACHEA